MRCVNVMLEMRAACGRGIGMCGYTAVPEDGRTGLIRFVAVQFDGMFRYGNQIASSLRVLSWSRVSCCWLIAVQDIVIVVQLSTSTPLSPP